MRRDRLHFPPAARGDEEVADHAKAVADVQGRAARETCIGVDLFVR
jgi:hypothetical protein